jgi:hypothetical protein
MYLDSLWEYKCVCITWRRAQTSAEKRIVLSRARACVCVAVCARASLLLVLWVTKLLWHI